MLQAPDPELVRNPPGRRYAPIAVGVLLFVSVGIWLMGYVTTLTFNVAVGREGAFGDESFSRLWQYGQRALVPPAFVLIIAGLVLLAIQPIWRLLTRGPVALARRINSIDSAYCTAAATVRSDSNTVAQFLLLTQLSVTAFLCWRFWNILSAFTQRLSKAPYQALLPLSPDIFMADERGWFVIYVSLSMLAMIVSWVILLRDRQQGAGRIAPITIAAGVTVPTLLFLLLVIPWRIMYANKHERVELSSNRCYIVGEQPTHLLLYCPDVPPPKTFAVSADDPDLRRLHVFESIFTPPAPSSGAVSGRSPR